MQLYYEIIILSMLLISFMQQVSYVWDVMIRKREKLKEIIWQAVNHTTSSEGLSSSLQELDSVSYWLQQE